MTDQAEMGDQPEAQQPTTTHAEWGAGNPHLRITGPDDQRSTFDLTADEVTIGSGADCALVLAGADPVHATVTHDERDEYVLTLHGAGEMNSNQAENPGDERTQILRTGARFRVGDWTLVYGREEYADHGRPYGGRSGGELSDQDSQPARPDYTGQSQGIAEVAQDDERGEEVRDG